MTVETDKVIEIARLQKEVMKQLGLKQDNIIFNYKDKENIVRLDLITINPKHDQSFLFHSTKGIDQVESLQKMLDYVINRYQNDDSYTIQWLKTGDDELQTSYFRGKNMYEALDKFYYGRDLSSHKIFSVTLNPVA